MDTLRRVKTINPGVCGVMYLNTLLAFPFYKLNGSVFSTALPLPPLCCPALLATPTRMLWSV